MPDVGRPLHRGTTDVDPHFTVADGFEGDQVSGSSAVQSYHVRKCTERTAHGDRKNGPACAPDVTSAWSELKLHHKQ